MKSMLICTFALIVLAWNFSASSGFPSSYSTAQIDGDVEYTKHIDTANNFRNNRPKRSTCYCDDASYGYPRKSYRTPIRRQDDADDVEYTPLVRFKERRTKRKKFFVPNTFG